MAKLTITKAAKQFSVGRSTLYRAIHSGRLTVHRENGVKYIDSSEMVRVYGTGGNPADTTWTSDDTALEQQLEVEKLHHKYLRSENALLKSELEKKDTIISNQRDMLTSFFKRIAPPKRK
jgi:excisionase family DNA binding protein